MGTVLGAICMFLNGFVTLVPYHIVVLCANHVIKRFHLPLYSVSLFIYRFHNPMELSNLFSTALAFALSLLNDGTFDTKNEDNIKFRRKVSFIAMWVTLGTTMLSCLIFIIGGDHGIFQLFYYSIILMTLSNGFSSCFAFSVNSNSIMYASVIVQYSFAIFSIFLTCTLWTVDQLAELNIDVNRDFNNDIAKLRVTVGGLVARRTRVEVNLSLTPTQEGPNNGAYYRTGDIQFRVEKVQNDSTKGVPYGYVRYEHRCINYQSFSSAFIRHDGIKLDGIWIDADQNINSVYVYYRINAYDPINEVPLIVCTKSIDCDIKYYKRGQTWSDAGQPLNGVDPESTTAGSSGGKLATTLNGLKDKYEINLNQTTHNGTYKANASGLEIKVTKDITVSNGVLSVYNRYKHSVSNGSTNTFMLNYVKHNNVTLNGIKEYGQNVQSVYVYYHKSDTYFQFPLLLCIKINNSVRKYYYRGRTWYEEHSLKDIDPERSSSADKIRHKLDMLNDIHEIRLEITNTIDNGSYKSSASGTTITVVKNDSYTTNNVPSGYMAFAHGGSISGTVKFKHNGNELVGLPTSGVNIDNSNKLWIYYKLENDNPIIDKPLLIYVKVNGIDKWYHRGLKWEETTDITGNPNDSQINIASSMEKLFKGKLARQGTFKELIYSDNEGHWSPILMLSLSLTIAYVFHPIIAPHSLIDNERDEIMDLTIMIISLIPNFILIILDNIQGDHGPSGKWDEGRWFYNYIWLIACIPYIVCIFILSFMFYFPNNSVCRHVKDNPYVLGFFSITINTNLKLMVSTALGGGPVQSDIGFIGSISQFNILLMLLLQLLITLFCNWHFNTLSLAENDSQPFAYRVYSPWSSLLLTNPTYVQQVPRIDHSQYPELIPGL